MVGQKSQNIAWPGYMKKGSTYGGEFSGKQKSPDNAPEILNTELSMVSTGFEEV